MDESLKTSLLERFRAYLDLAHDPADAPEESAETTDLYAVLVETAGLRSEVRTQSRLVKDALEQFRTVFETLQTGHATLQRELDRAREEARDQRQAALRPLLLAVIDLRDRVAAAGQLAASPPPRWRERLWRRPAPAGEAWREGLDLILRRFDQLLLDQQVVALRLAGRPFDPRLARVIATRPDAARPDGTVIEEVRAGFLWNHEVLRTAEVIVSKAAAPGEIS